MKVSMNHCRIQLVKGEVILFDLSSNGTFVNLVEVGKGNQQTLKSGDKVHFKIDKQCESANIVFIFEIFHEKTD